MLTFALRSERNGRRMGKTTKEIKRILFERDITISDLAREFNCYREQLSMMIRKVRIYPDLQEQFAQRLGYTREELFGTLPSDRRRAA